MTLDWSDFITHHTRPGRPPLVPEIVLRLTDCVTDLWRQLADEEEEGEETVSLPFWAEAWVGGQALARFVLDHPEEVVGRVVIDLGAGSGLCGIAALKVGAARVVAADVDPVAREAMRLNALANGVSLEVTGHNLLETTPPQVGLILAGDVFYEQPLAVRAEAWLLAAHRAGVRVLIGDPGRDYLPGRQLVQLAEYAISTSRDVEGVDVKTTGVFTFSEW